MLCRLVAHHSCAVIEAEERGLAHLLTREFAQPSQHLADALSFCDMTTSPDGEHVQVHNRLAEIHDRYGPSHLVSRCLFWDHTRSPGSVVTTVINIGTDACWKRRCLPILVTCWSCGPIANAATGTSTRHPRTCSSARTSAPGAATARRTSCTAYARTAAARSSGAPSARPIYSRSTRRRPSGLFGQDAPPHPPGDQATGEQSP